MFPRRPGRAILLRFLFSNGFGRAVLLHFFLWMEPGRAFLLHFPFRGGLVEQFLFVLAWRSCRPVPLQILVKFKPEKTSVIEHSYRVGFRVLAFGKQGPFLETDSSFLLVQRRPGGAVLWFFLREEAR